MNMDSINNYLDNNLSSKRKKHTEGVRNTAVKLAELYGANVKKADFAAMCHDMCKNIKGLQLNNYVKQFKLADKYLDNPNLAHSKLAAYMLEHNFDVDDKDILNAVSYHTTGRENMSLLEKIIFIADAIEPNRNYNGVDDLRKYAFKDIDYAVFLSLDRTVKYIRNLGYYLDEDTLYARDYYKQKEKING